MDRPLDSMTQEEQFVDSYLEHHGVKGMKWGVRKDDRGEKKITRAAIKKGEGLNPTAKAGVRKFARAKMVANANLAAQLAFQAQRYTANVKELYGRDQTMARSIDQMQRLESLKTGKDYIPWNTMMNYHYALEAVAGFGGGAVLNVVGRKAAKALILPMQKVYGDSKRRINRDINAVNSEIRNGTRHLSAEKYNREISRIVKTHMTTERNKVLSPFYEMARRLVGAGNDPGNLKVDFSEIPNSRLYQKMTVTSPHGYQVQKAIRKVPTPPNVVKHDDESESFDLYFHYNLAPDGLVEEFSCPTIEILDDYVNDRTDRLTAASMATRYRYPKETEKGGEMTQEEQFVDTYLEHHGVKGMRWGVRKNDRGTSVKSRRRSIPVITDFSSDSKGVDEKVKDIATNMVTSGLARGTTGAAALYGTPALYVGMGKAMMAAGATSGTATSMGTLLAAAATASSIGGVTAVAAIQTMRAAIRPTSMAYKSSKGDIRRGVKELNKKAVTDKDTYLREYHSIVNKAIQARKPSLTSPFRNVAEFAGGKKSSAPWDINISRPDEKGRMNVTIQSPNGPGLAGRLTGTYKLGRVRHDEEDDVPEVYTTVINPILNSKNLVEDVEIPLFEFLLEVEKLEASDIDSLSQEEDIDAFLEHHGVKGMRWGVQRAIDSATGLIKGSKFAGKSGDKKGEEVKPKSSDDAPPKPGSADHERLVTAMVKRDDADGNRTLSNEEIQMITKRVQAEKNLNSLLDPKTDLQKQYEELQFKSKIRELKAAEAEANAGAGKKLVKFMVGAVGKGIQSEVEGQLGELGKMMMGDLVKHTNPKGTSAPSEKREKAKKGPKAGKTRREKTPPSSKPNVPPRSYTPPKTTPSLIRALSAPQPTVIKMVKKTDASGNSWFEAE